MKSCRLGNWKDARYLYQDEDPTAPSDIARKINMYKRRWEAIGMTNPHHPYRAQQEATLKRFWDRMGAMGNIVESRRFNGRLRDAIETRALDKLGRMFQWFTRTGVDKVTEDAIVGFERRARGAIADIFADLEVAKVAETVHKTFNDIGKRHNLKDFQIAELTWDVVELGTQPYLAEATLDGNEMMYKILAKRQDQVFEKARRYGITEPELDQLVDSAKQLVQTNSEVLALAGKMGLDIGELRNMGYMSRIFKRETEDVLKIIENGGIYNPKSNPIRLESTAQVTAAFQESRKWFDFVTEDAQVLDYLFRRAGVFDKLNKMLPDMPDLVHSLGGKKKINDIADLLTGDDGALNYAVLKMLDQEDVNTMLELGIMHKIPWETSRVHQYLQKRYKLPFGINDMYVSDPRQVVDIYQKQLQAVATERSKVWGILDGAMKSGWGKTANEVASDPKVYKGWRPIREAFPDSLLEKMGMQNVDVMEHLDNFYAPPEIIRTLKADMTIATNPVMMGMFGNTMKIIKNWAGAGMMGTTQWLGRQVIGWAGNLLASGINPAGYFSDFTKYMYGRVREARGKQFDFSKMLGTKKVFGGMSEQELWRYGVKKGLLNDFNIFGEQGTITQRTAARTVRMLKWYASEYPDYFGGSLGDVLSLSAKELLADRNPVSFYLGWGNNITDNLGKFQMLKALMNDARRKVPELMDTLPRLDIDDAIEYVFAHSWNYDNLSVGGNKWHNSTFLQTVVPFVQWRVKNVQQAALMAIEHPHLFGSYLYLTGQPTNELKSERPVEWEMMNNSWWDEGSRPIWWIVPAELSPTGNEEFFMYPATNFIPQLGALQDVGDLLDTIGMFQNSSKLPSERTDNPWQENATLLQRLAKEQTVPFIEALLAVYSGTDNWGRDWETLREGGKKRTMLGIQIDPMAHYFISVLVPAIKQVDRTMSFTGLTGTAPTVNPISGEFTPGSPSWTGVTPDYPVLGQQPSPTGNRTADTLLSMAGALPYYIDIYLSAQYTITDLKIMNKNAEKDIKAYRYKLAQSPSMQRDKELNDQLENLQIWHYHLALELGYYEAWKQKVGLNDKRATDAILQQNLRVRDYLTNREKEQVEEKVRSQME